MSQTKARDSASSPPDSSTPDHPSTLTPASTAPNTPQRARSGSSSPEDSVIVGRSNMDKDSVEGPAKDDAGVTKGEEEKAEKDMSGVAEQDMNKEDAKETSTTTTTITTTTTASGKKDKKKIAKCKKHAAKKKKHAAKSSKRSSKHRATSPSSDSDSDASTDSDSESEASDSDSDTSSSSEDEKAKKKRKARAKRKAALKKKEKKAKKHRKSKKQESSDDSDSSSESDASEAETESEESSADERASRRRRSRTKSKRVTVEDTSTEAEETTTEEGLEVEAATAANLQEQLNALHLSIQAKQARLARSRARAAQAAQQAEQVVVERSRSRRKEKKEKEQKEKEKGKTKKGKKGALEFKRVDELWDSNVHDWKLRESNEEQDDQFGDSVFTVRRRFNWENKYRDTVVDIKSKLLREALQTIMKDVKSVSLVEEEPCLDPNTLFLYLEEIRVYYKKTIKAMIKKEKKRKQIKRLKLIRSHVKVMLDYLDDDYGETKKKLYPLIEAGNITFDLLWALFKPNTLAFTNTYGSIDDPRCFKVDYAYKEQSFIRGEWYAIEGRYLEYDGKHFGLGDFSISVDAFKGPRKITSLATYPLEYHKESDKLKEQLVERGKKFVMMQGMNYKFHKGLAFVKKKKAVAKVTINGRVMIDPAIFRRINPNYPISVIKPKEDSDIYSDDEDDCSCDEHSDDEYAGGNVRSKDDDDEPKMAWKIIWDKDDKPQFVRVPVDEHGQIIKPEKLEQLPNSDEKDKAKTPQVFGEEELLIASPVVLGFSFKEKLWLEFSLSGIQEIEWNDGAFESLVIPTNQKSIVKALVSSHKFHAAETIDDVVQGKGKGLVFVLHGPPGVGKTLTAEGIAETLKTPLYAVSAGELGMDQRNIEHELQRIMDIAHSWGAVLLLDEADVFLEKRQVQDVGRNAMVSIFLRLLEYFQGILFLTTNRVETFDEAFQSRIHLALKYEELGQKARKDVWKQFLGMVKSMEGKGTLAFTERDYELLARHNLNGRQIKNAVRTAQALAVNERQKLTMEHIQRVLAVAESFERDMKGLTLDAMKQYV